MSLFSRLTLSAFFTLILLVLDLVLGHFSHCLSLQVVTNQCLYNLMSLSLSTATIMLSHNTSPAIRLRSTFSWKRLEVVGMLCSLVCLGSLFFGTFIESLQTISHSGHLDVMHNPVGVFLLATGHFFIWMLVFLLIGGYSRQQSKSTVASESLAKGTKDSLPSGNETKSTIRLDYNQGVRQTLRAFIHQAKYRDIFRDLIGIFLLMISTVVVYLVDEETHPRVSKFVDPLISIVSIGVILAVSLPMIKGSCYILLQTIPEDMCLDSLTDELMQEFSGQIVDIHELHVWCLVPTKTVATLHVTYKNETTYLRINSCVEELLRSKGIRHVTIQPEFSNAEEDGEDCEVVKGGCLLICRNTNCSTKRCCTRPASPP